MKNQLIKKIMEKGALIITGAALLTACNKNNPDTSKQTATTDQSVLSGKEWQIKSIVTSPAVIDVNGDGEKDQEIISSLQKKEQNKKIIFAAGGKVFEKYIPENGQAEDEAIQQNGTWSNNTKDGSLTWKQSDGTSFTAKIYPVSLNQVKLVYKDNNLEATYLIEHN